MGGCKSTQLLANASARMSARAEWTTSMDHQALALERLRFANSYDRMPALLALRPHLDRVKWWRILGEEWTGCDNIAAFKRDLKPLLREASREELDLMMEPHELAAWASLPELLTVYRGCYFDNRHGFSWTLDRATAERFVTLNRYSRPGQQPLLARGRVRRTLAVLKTDRDEQEIISAHVRLSAMEPITRD